MRLCFIGDSLVNGYGDPECMGWTGRVARHYKKTCGDLTWYNLGVRGQTSYDILLRWEDETRLRLLPEYPRILVFSFGVNDTKLDEGRLRVEIGQSLANTGKILSHAVEEYPVCMVGPVAVTDNDHNERIQVLSNELMKHCFEMNVPYLDIFSVLRDNTNWMKDLKESDGVHPGATGYDIIASLVLQWEPWQDFFKAP